MTLNGEVPKEVHFARIEFIFVAKSEDELPVPELLRDTMKEVFPNLLQVSLGHSIETVNVLMQLLLETRGLINPKQPRESAQKFSEWSRTRDKVLNTLMENPG